MNPVRFFGNEGAGEDADAMEWRIFERMKASCYSKDCWCLGRPFDKLRVTNWGEGTGTDAAWGDAAYNGESAVIDRLYRRNARQCGWL